MYLTSSKAESNEATTPTGARTFLRTLSEADWNAARPVGSAMSGADYQAVWNTLSGETPASAL